MKTYNQNQMSLIPQTWEDCLSPNHMVLYINDIIEEIDISKIRKVYETELRGYPPYHPLMMLKMLIYGYCIGVRSSRKISQKCEDDIGRQGKKKKSDDDPPPTPGGKDQYNFTDPESRIMPASDDRKSSMQGYNAQLAVDSKNQIIVANNLCNQTNDQKQLKEIVPKIKGNFFHS